MNTKFARALELAIGLATVSGAAFSVSCLLAIGVKWTLVVWMVHIG